MKDEIKEILGNLIDLQDRIKELETINEEYIELNKELYYRINKATEYIKSLNGDYDLELANCVEYNLLNILQGSDE